MQRSSYKQFFFMSALHFVVMYLIMYTMIDSTENFFHNANQLYMTLMMVAGMSLVMLWTMRAMYDKTMLKTLTIGSVVLFAGSFYFMRDQTFVGNKQFLRSMIPHHAGALLMCHETQASDPEIKSLCESILRSQQSEIDQMKKILERL